MTQKTGCKQCNECNRFVGIENHSIKGLCVKKHRLKSTMRVCSDLEDLTVEHPAMSESELRELTSVIMVAREALGEDKVASTIMKLSDYYKQKVGSD